jgi:hypothetical protein
MVSPKTRRITPFLAIPAGMARLFFSFFGLNPVEAAVSAAARCVRRRHACRYSFDFAAKAAAFYNRRMIKDRPHRLDLLYIDQPLYFVTFATRDRRRIPRLIVLRSL